MEITNKFCDRLVRFDSLAVGDTFICGGEPYMKICLRQTESYMYNAVNLYNYDLECIEDSAVITKVIGELILK